MDTTNLNTGSIQKHLIRLSVPAIVGYFFHTMFNITDTYFAGLISTEALAALSLSSSIFFMIIAIAIGMSEALTSLVGNEIGRGDMPKAQHIALNSIVFAITLSLILSTVGLMSMPYLLKAIGNPSYAPETMHYINTILYASLFFIGSFFFNSLLNAMGDTVSFRNILIITSILNIVLNYTFVNLFGFGVIGIAIATVISEFVSMSYLFYKLKKTNLWLGCTRLVFDIKVIKELLRQGFPPSMNMFMIGLGMYIITYYIVPYGSEAVAAYGIAVRIEQVFLMPVAGLSVATLTIISRNNGARLYYRIRPTINFAIRYGFIFSAIGVISFFIFGNLLSSFLTDNEEIMNLSTTYLRICGFAFFAFVIIFISIAMLQGIAKPNIIFPISVYRQVIAPVLLFSFFSLFHLPIESIWFGLNAIIFSSAIYLWKHSNQKLGQLYHERHFHSYNE